MLSFLKKRRMLPGLTGIEMREDGVSVVQVVREPGRLPHVTACDFRAWSAPDEKVLASIASQYELKRARCTTVLASSEYNLLLTEAPDVPPDELRSAMRWRIKDLIDFHIDDATIDVFDVTSPNGQGRMRPMYVVAARNGAIQRRVDMCDAAHVGLDVIDIPEMAQRNLASVLPEDVQGVVMLTMEARRGLITITRQGELFLSRRLEIGTETLNEALDREPYFDRVALEIQRSLDYFDSHFRQAPVDQLVFSPSVESVPGLVEHMNRSLSIRSKVLALDEVLQFEPSYARLLADRALVALGAALRHEEKAL